MKNVFEKKYLGDIISSDLKNKKNITDKTNKGVGNVNKILTSLNERPYGRHTYKAAKLLREGMLLGSMLTNCESWINITESDLKDLEKPDTMLQRKLLSSSGNPSKAFMYLELGITPVKYVIMGRRVNFLHYILNEHIESMVGHVFRALKEDSRKGDFWWLVQKDLKELNIYMDEIQIRNHTKWQWKQIVKTV